MAEAKQESKDHQIDAYPRDLLLRFGSGNLPSVVAVKEEPMEVELSLGLSLGGSFGVDPKQKGLLRASSIAAFSFFPEEKAVEEQKGLMRTCSLPVETGEEQRKRKEMQSLRRLEAKRKRSEKRGLKVGGRESNCQVEDEIQQIQVVNGVVIHRQRRDQLRCCPRVPVAVSGRQGSSGTQGGCSTSSSDYDCRPMEGLDISGLGSSSAEARSPPSTKPPAKHTDKKAPLYPAAPIAAYPIGCAREENASEQSKLASIGSNGAREMARSMMAKMPHVSTKGEGPNGRRVEGFLYKYTKGEDVRIVCVCCGNFLTPAEFVKHAGGGDVEYPLRHIVVYPSSPQTFL